MLRREYTKSCDIWSIGVITYILLCGYPPFYGDSDAEIFDSVRTGKFDFPSPEWDDISVTAKEFVRYLLQKDPRERYATTIELSIWLQMELIFSMHRPTALQAMNHRWIQMHVSVDGKVSEKPSLLRNTDRGTTFQKFLAMQKLKKAALLAIASSLTQAEVGSLGDIFCRIDQKGDGVMTLTELDDAISRGMWALCFFRF